MVEQINLGTEVDQFFSVLRKFPHALDQDVEALENSIKEKFDLKHIIANNPLAALGVAGAIGILASGAIKLPDSDSSSEKSALLDNPVVSTVTTVALTSLLKMLTEKIESL